MFQDFTCPFCLQLTVDSVMCTFCEHVFCMSCQKKYHCTAKKTLCVCCRQETKEKYRPLSDELREKRSLLKFKCDGCNSILTASDHGIGKGEHEDSCKLSVRYSCTCGEAFCSTYSNIK